MQGLWMAVVAIAAMPAFADQPSVDQLVDGIRSAYQLRRGYTQVVRLYILRGPDPSRPLETIEERELPLLFDREHEQRELWVHPTLGVLMDMTDPRVREARGRLRVSVYSNGLGHSIQGLNIQGAQRVQAERVHLAEGVSSNAAPVYMPAGFGAIIGLMAKGDPAARVERAGSGALLLVFPAAGQSYEIDPVDFTVLAILDSSDPRRPMQKRYLGLEETPIITARLPRYAVTRVGPPGGDGQNIFQTCMVFSPPVVDPPMPASWFQWTTYADVAVDRKEDKVYDNKERLIGTVEEVFGRPVAAGGESVTLDQDRWREREADPSQGLTPPLRSRTRTGLVIFGLVALVLALLWSIRRRMA